MPHSPLISVVMPVRDASSTVDAAVESVLEQTYDRFELVAVNDHSTDDTAARLQGWSTRDPRVRIVTPASPGLIVALNAGVAAARAPIIARMDADDLMHPRRLELQTAFHRTRPEIDIVSCWVESFPRHAVREGYRIYERWLNRLTDPDAIARERFVESPIPHPTAYLRRSTLLEIGGYRDNDRPEDYDLWLRLLNRGARAAKVPEVLHAWRESPDRHSRTHSRYSADNFLRTKAEHLADAVGPRPVLMWGAGQVSRRLARYLLEHGVDIEAFYDIDPAKIGRTARDRPVRAPHDLPPAGRHVVLSAVGSREARALIRPRVAARHYREGVDFYCVA